MQRGCIWCIFIHHGTEVSGQEVQELLDSYGIKFASKPKE
jgi:hypothetical protein